jgi:RNA polymerase sigma-70 factor (ECF subfamily)
MDPNSPPQNHSPSPRQDQPAVSAGDVTQLLANLRNGQPAATSELMPLVYDELHRLARQHMRHERPDHTLQPTALVHEAFLHLVSESERTWQNRTHFIRLAAQVMRRLLIDHARARRTAKREGRLQRIPLDEPLLVTDDQSDELLALNEALDRLAAIDARQSRIVELRFFGGLTVEETADALGVSPKTVKRDWTVARAWLHRELQQSRRHDA